MKLLLAVDGSTFSDAAVEQIASRPWPEGTEVDVLSVAEQPAYPMGEAAALPSSYYEEMEKIGQQQSRAAVDKAVERLRSGASSLRVTANVVAGHPVQEIVDRAEQWDADLLVVGSHGYRGFKRLLLGSVSQAVASHAKCSVEIVRRKQIANGSHG
ncbi:MAG TPA: universal stress protein [Blastocatellia bacterium]|nr:universal stress protein [Blastocatellia bacterium]